MSAYVGNTPVPVYAPQLSVKLIKMIQRTGTLAGRYIHANRVIDLMPLLGEAGTVSTTKGIYTGAGSFSVTFQDQPDPSSAIASQQTVNTGDTVYALVEPMDMIEIRMTRTPIPPGGLIPLVMRGFVEEVQRNEAMNDDGSPQRTTTISGKDGAKLLQLAQIFWQLGVAEQSNMLSAFQLFNLTGLDVTTLLPGAFMRQIIEKVINPKITDLQNLTLQKIPYVAVDQISVQEGAVFVGQYQSFQGAISALMDQVADRPWNELFMQDQEDGWHLVFRPCPWFDINGKLIMPNAEDPGYVPVDIAFIQSMALARSDAGIANYFWVPPDGNTLNDPGNLTAAALASGQPLDFQYGNNSPTLYGARKLEVGTGLQATDMADIPGNLLGDGRVQATTDTIGWYNTRQNELKLLNRDNGVFESGTLQCMGSELLVAGKYIQVTRGSLTWKAYVAAVRQTFQPFGNWTSSLEVVRGTGFLERIKLDGPPFWAEGREGPNA